MEENDSIRDYVLKLWQDVKHEILEIEKKISGDDSPNTFLNLYELYGKASAYSRVLHLLEKQ